MKVWEYVLKGKSIKCYLSKGLSEILRKKSVEHGIDTGTTVGQHVRRNLESHFKVRVCVEQ